MKNKTHFHKKGCAPSLNLKVRVFGTRKWPIKMEIESDQRLLSHGKNLPNILLIFWNCLHIPSQNVLILVLNIQSVFPVIPLLSSSQSGSALGIGLYTDAPA